MNFSPFSFPRIKNCIKRNCIGMVGKYSNFRHPVNEKLNLTLIVICSHIFPFFAPATRIAYNLLTNARNGKCMSKISKWPSLRPV